MARRRASGKNQSMTLNLLIVDDSELIRHSLLELLRGIVGAASIRCVATLSQALDSVRSAWPTLVVLDLHFAAGNAIPRIGLIKQLAPGIRIAVLTNDAVEFTRIRCMQAGADWFFDKSTEFEKLMEIVRQQAGDECLARALSIAEHCA